MTPEISDIIEQIKQKFIDLSGKYKQEVASVNQLKQETSELNVTLEEAKKENNSLTEQISALKSEIEELNKKMENSVSHPNKDEEIDLLVREIDHCINQLKSN